MTLLQSGPNPLRSESFTLTSLASALVVRVNGGPIGTKTSAPDNTLFGEGVTEGSRVRIRDIGGMWTSSIPVPVIYVEAIGPTHDSVAAEINRLVGSLTSNLQQLQDELHVPAYGRVVPYAAPAEPEVVEVSGQRVKAAGVTTLVGLAITVLALYAVDRRWPRRRREPETADSRSHSPGGQCPRAEPISR